MNIFTPDYCPNIMDYIKLAQGKGLSLYLNSNSSDCEDELVFVESDNILESLYFTKLTTYEVSARVIEDNRILLQSQMNFFDNEEYKGTLYYRDNEGEVTAHKKLFNGRLCDIIPFSKKYKDLVLMNYSTIHDQYLTHRDLTKNYSKVMYELKSLTEKIIAHLEADDEDFDSISILKDPLF